jgi:hydrogenase maturation protease
MNRALVERIAAAVLYEGYILYPYRPSTKNRQRWTFGGLYPEAYCKARQNGDASGNQTECLVDGNGETTVDVTVRFLHLTARQACEVASGTGEYRPVETLRVGDKQYHTWQEAEERNVAAGAVTIGELLAHPLFPSFSFPGGRKTEPIRGPCGGVEGTLIRTQRPLVGEMDLSAAEVADRLYRITLRVSNRTPWKESAGAVRDDVLLQTLVSAHAVLGVRGGGFVSLTDPPDECREAAAACRNIGVWPVLVGENGETDTLLSSPIILPDYPQVAAESPGDFFDAAEIDEMLALRIMTLTDDEKRSMAAVDDRAGALLARTESLAREQLMGLHGRLSGG